MITNYRRPRIFTWNIHGSYLYYLSQGNFDIYIPVNTKRTEGYAGRGNTFPFGDNVIEVPAENVKQLEFDCILFQCNKNFLVDQYEVLSAEQRRLARIYLEHDPPLKHPVSTLHVVNDRDVLTVHVTHSNKLMWENSGSTVVIEHGVTDPGISYSGKKRRGIVVVNNLPKRGRICGFDVFKEIRKEVPLDLIGLNTEECGFGEIAHPELPAFISEYRFMFNPTRYCSFGLAVCEAMMTGLPVVGLANAEAATVFRNGLNGYVHTDTRYLIQKMQLLLSNDRLAHDIGQAGRRTAQDRFGIGRFVTEWERIFRMVIEQYNSPAGFNSNFAFRSAMPVS